MRSTALLFQYAAPIIDPAPWKKAASYSVAGHALALFFLVLATMHARKAPTIVLTEVNLIEKAQVSVKKGPEEVAGRQEGRRIGSESPDVVAQKANSEINTSGYANLGTSTDGSVPSGKGSGSLGGNVPLSGPIVTSEPIGWVGRKTGALKEFSKRTGGAVGGGLPGGKESSGPLQEPIALSKMGVDDIRKTEAAIGIPIVSRGAGSGLIGGTGTGSGRTLAGTEELGRKRKTAVESLKANPFEKGKWGKQKGPFSMEGPLKYRKILRLELPPYPRWAEEKGIEASISIRLWVDPKGTVKDNMYLEKTSGYSEIDHLAMDALRQFKFVPLPADQAQEDEWGVATFRFELKR